MRKNFSDVKKIIVKIPIDIRQTFICFFLSCTIMMSAILALSFFGGESTPLKGKSEVQTKTCNLEPYHESKEVNEEPITLPYIMANGNGISEELTEELLAYAIEENLAGESYAVRVGFGAVLLNRTADDAFSNTLSGVLTASGLYPKLLDGKISERSLHAARDAMLGVDPTLGALYMMSVSDPLYTDYKNRVTAVYDEYAFLK